MKFEFLKHSPSGPFEGVELTDWQNWQWQVRQSLKTQKDFAEVYQLSADEEAGFEAAKGLFKTRTTPYYATLGDPQNPRDPLRLIQTPTVQETTVRFQHMHDPLGENKNSVTPRLVHRYKDRVLFLVTDFCSVYCRFCTRKRFTGQDQAFASNTNYVASLDYIRAHSEISEVILSGGDPLTLSDDLLDQVLRDIRAISHIEIIRVGSRMPTVNPFRMTDSVAKVLQKHTPVYLMTHFNHPRELTYEAAEALGRIADHGVPMMNQMVLLNGINNHANIVRALSRRLLYLRVKPYYMFQCDPSKGSDHLRTSIEDSLAIQRELWGDLSGLAMPTFSIDIPHGGGKTSMSPNFLVSSPENARVQSMSQKSRAGCEHDISSTGGTSVPPNLPVAREQTAWKFKGYDGVESEYIDPAPEFIRKPIDADQW